MKTCTMCREPKPFTQFSKRAAARDGHTPFCKECIAHKRKGATHGVTGARTEVPEELRKEVFLGAILRMKQSGIASDYTVRQMAERVGDM